MAKKGKTTTRYRYRSAVDGKFVTAEYAQRHPRTTVKETVRVPPRR
jgi:hypothetical protein